MKLDLNSKTPIAVIACLILMVLCNQNVYANLNKSGENIKKEVTSLQKNKKGLRVLVFSGTGWYRHPEIPLINGWLVRLGSEHNMRVDVSETGADITPDNLDRYDVLLLNNANVLNKILSLDQKEAIQNWYRDGHSIVALHAVLVHQEEWPWLMDLGGCDFNSDSEFLPARVIVDPEALDHPAVKGWGKEFWYKADWTNHDKSVTDLPGLQVLLRVDESTYEPVRDYFKTRGGKPMGKDHPVAWIRTWNGGKFFYTELGHDLRSLNTEFGRQHIIGGIRWVTDKAEYSKQKKDSKE